MGVLTRLNQMVGQVRSLFGYGARNLEFTAPVMERNPDVPSNVMEAVRHGFEKAEEWRKHEALAINEFMCRWGAIGDQSRMMINPIRKFARIVLPMLSSGDPRALVEPKFPSLKPFALKFQVALNNRLQEIRLGEALEQGVAQSLFSMMILKTGLSMGSATFEGNNGEIIDAGEAYTDSILLNNYSQDMDVTDWRKASFQADRYQVPAGWIKQLREEGEGAILDSLEGSIMQPSDRPVNQREEPDKRIYKTGWVWDVYLPQQGLLCVYADEQSSEPLISFPYDGKQGGPYDLGGYDFAPGMPLPSPPTAYLITLAKTMVGEAGKLRDQAERSKTNPIFNIQEAMDAKIWDKAKDGDPLGLTNPEIVRELRTGGPDPAMMNYQMVMSQQFDEDAGSLRTLAGSSPMSETVGQDQILNSAANKYIDRMRGKIVQVLKSVISKHAWFIWTEPVRTYRGFIDIKGTDIRLPFEIPPYDKETRRGDFLDFNFNIIPHSLAMKSPEQMAQQEIFYWNQVLMPNIQILMESGDVPNAKAHAERVADLLGINVADLLLPLDQQVGSPEKPGKTPGPQWLGNTGAQAPPPQTASKAMTRDAQESMLMASNSKLMDSKATGGGR